MEKVSFLTSAYNYRREPNHTCTFCSHKHTHSKNVFTTCYHIEKNWKFGICVDLCEKNPWITSFSPTGARIIIALVFQWVWAENVLFSCLNNSDMTYGTRKSHVSGCETRDVGNEKRHFSCEEFFSAESGKCVFILSFCGKLTVHVVLSDI